MYIQLCTYTLKFQHSCRRIKVLERGGLSALAAYIADKAAAEEALHQDHACQDQAAVPDQKASLLEHVPSPRVSSLAAKGRVIRESMQVLTSDEDIGHARLSRHQQHAVGQATSASFSFLGPEQLLEAVEHSVSIASSARVSPRGDGLSAAAGNRARSTDMLLSRTKHLVQTPALSTTEEPGYGSDGISPAGANGPGRSPQRPSHTGSISLTPSEQGDQPGHTTWQPAATTGVHSAAEGAGVGAARAQSAAAVQPGAVHAVVPLARLSGSVATGPQPGETTRGQGTNYRSSRFIGMTYWRGYIVCMTMLYLPPLLFGLSKLGTPSGNTDALARHHPSASAALLPTALACQWLHGMLRAVSRETQVVEWQQNAVCQLLGY